MSEDNKENYLKVSEKINDEIINSNSQDNLSDKKLVNKKHGLGDSSNSQQNSLLISCLINPEQTGEQNEWVKVSELQEGMDFGGVK